MSKRTGVTLYCVGFKGVYGRNRSVKFTCSDPVEITPTIPFEFEGKVELGVDLQSRAWDYASKIGAKRGNLFVTRYDDCETDSYVCDAEGNTALTTVIPITQGVRVYSEDFKK